MSPVLLFGFVILVIWLFNSLNVLREYERGVIFRIGRLLPEAKGPGLIWVFFPIDRIVRVGLRTITMDVPTFTILVFAGIVLPCSIFLFSDHSSVAPGHLNEKTSCGESSPT